MVHCHDLILSTLPSLYKYKANIFYGLTLIFFIIFFREICFLILCEHSICIQLWKKKLENVILIQPNLTPWKNCGNAMILLGFKTPTQSLHISCFMTKVAIPHNHETEKIRIMRFLLVIKIDTKYSCNKHIITKYNR